ncbi:MAG: hypothetical protein H8F28_24290, partial [Fibrella sp.]|nr:hypothetical protein [Armatimonadota bacterium]
QSVRRLGATDYLVADTGNNRVVRIDRGGILRWSVDRLNDPYGILAPGDPETLNAPTDVLTRQLSSFNAGGVRVGFETHYLIADSGNGRIVDVVDYFDLNGQPRIPVGTGASTGVVVWTTRTKSQSGENLSYHNLQLIAGRDGALAGKPILVASVSNSGVASVNNNDASNTSGGSLVQLDYNPYNTGFVLVDPATGVFNQVKYYWAQAAGTTQVYNPATATIPEPATNGKPLLAINELRFKNGGNVSAVKRLNAATYFEQIPLNIAGTPAPESVYLIVDADGVYACIVQVDVATGKSFFDVLWRFGQEDYDRINGGTPLGGRFYGAAAPVAPLRNNALPRFSPSSVKRLANGHFLITNSASGASALFESGQFLGEVFEVSLPPVVGTSIFDVDATSGVVNNTVGAGALFEKFSAPSIERGADAFGTNPRRLNKQQMGRDTNGAPVTEQPRSADRL